MKPTPKQIAAVNRAIDRVCKGLRACNAKSIAYGCPVKGITFRVLNNGNTRIHVAYKRK